MVIENVWGKDSNELRKEGGKDLKLLLLRFSKGNDDRESEFYLCSDISFWVNVKV